MRFVCAAVCSARKVSMTDRSVAVRTEMLDSAHAHTSPLTWLVGQCAQFSMFYGPNALLLFKIQHIHNTHAGS